MISKKYHIFLNLIYFNWESNQIALQFLRRSDKKEMEVSEKIRSSKVKALFYLKFTVLTRSNSLHKNLYEQL